jgi:hypothetical protein
MLIINQDKTGLINLKNIVGLNVVKKACRASQSAYNFFEYDYCIQAYMFDNHCEELLLGRFSYKENAIKVLNMIQQQYQYIEECKYLGIGCSQPEFVFAIPTDEEMRGEKNV